MRDESGAACVVVDEWNREKGIKKVGLVEKKGGGMGNAIAISSKSECQV